MRFSFFGNIYYLYLSNLNLKNDKNAEYFYSIINEYRADDFNEFRATFESVIARCGKLEVVIEHELEKMQAEPSLEERNKLARQKEEMRQKRYEAE